MKNNKYKKAVFMTIALSIVLRIIFIVFSKNTPVSDFDIYYKIAVNIFNGKGCSLNGKPVAFQSMGYALLLGSFFKLTGSSKVITGIILNLILSIIFLISAALIVKKIFGESKISVITLIIIAFMPNYIAYINVLGSEMLCLALLSLSILVIMSNLKLVLKSLLFGIICGLLSLVKPFFMLYPFVVLVADMLCHIKLKEAFMKAAVSTILMIVIVAPWTIRNYINFHSFIPVSYNGGYVLYINNNSNNHHGAWMRISDINVSDKIIGEFKKEGFNFGGTLEEELKAVNSNPRLEAIFKSEAKKWIVNHKIDFFYLGIKRMKNTFFSGSFDINEWCLNGKAPINNMIKGNITFTAVTSGLISSMCLLSFIYALMILLKALYGVVKKEKYFEYYRLLLSILIMFISSTYFVFEGQPRYNFPLLFIFTIVTVDILNKFKKIVEKKLEV